jgi:hypothetical protein
VIGRIMGSVITDVTSLAAPAVGVTLHDGLGTSVAITGTAPDGRFEVEYAASGAPGVLSAATLRQLYVEVA